MILDSKICEYIIPDSELIPEAASYEFFLVWLAPNGAVNCWMFEDYNEKQQIQGQVINTKTANITKIFSGAQNIVTLTAEDLTENEFDCITDILRAKLVRRYLKDNTYENLAILSDSVTKQKSQNRYRFEFDVQRIEKSILK